MFKTRILPYFVWLIYRLWTATWRVKLFEPQELQSDLQDPKTPIIFAFWHGDEIAAVAFTRFFKMATMTSTSNDGELMTRVVHLLGVKTSRGSSTRGGAQALRGLIRLGREGYVTSVAVDGPKGPIHKAKPGVFELSRILGAKIYPCGFFAERSIRFNKSWNKTYLPLPFSRVVMTLGPSLGPVKRSEDPKLSLKASELESQLNATSKLAANLIDSDPRRC